MRSGKQTAFAAAVTSVLFIAAAAAQEPVAPTTHDPVVFATEAPVIDSPAQSPIDPPVQPPQEPASPVMQDPVDPPPQNPMEPVDPVSPPPADPVAQDPVAPAPQDPVDLAPKDPIDPAPKGPVVTFSDLRDAEPLKFFDAATSAPDAVDGNTLVIGFNSGFDPNTWLANDFRASGLPFSRRIALDTISFSVEAPSGYSISKITYVQRGAGSMLRGEFSSGAASWVVAGFPASLGAFQADPKLSGTADLASLNLTRVPVSITLGLFASSGSVAVTSAEVLVELQPLTR